MHDWYHKNQKQVLYLFGLPYHVECEQHIGNHIRPHIQKQQPARPGKPQGKETQHHQ